MNSATSRTPPDLAAELKSSLSVVAVGVNLWAILTFLRYIPSLVLRLTTSEVIGVAGYVLAVALLEAVLLSSPIVVIALVLRALGRQAHLGIYTAGVAVSLLLSYLPCTHDWPLAGDCRSDWPALSLVLLLSWIGLVRLGLRWFPAWVGKVSASVARLTPLALLYLAIDLSAVVVVAVRLATGLG